MHFAKVALIVRVGKSRHAHLFHRINLVATDRMCAINESIERSVADAILELFVSFIAGELVLRAGLVDCLGRHDGGDDLFLYVLEMK